MPQYLALIYSADVDWWAPEQASELAEYRQFAVDNADCVRASAVLHPTTTATVVRVEGARGGKVVTTDGPYAETKEALTGYYLIDAEDLDAAVAIAAELPAAWGGAVELRPVIAAK
ncbi:YciI family protein [Amycolatopsis sp. H20-H5]|uniref:YciI family protein n=1 Tax=Amycolatopsis sp. H20-H5 TaxID=3046309 RepID=UPI002DBD9645|nr:YciI family protein [Amycolatopsis sp. H20-H5]MEC3976131.1 YciI family protein [Amycolatopsis sp. H20-H5]